MIFLLNNNAFNSVNNISDILRKSNHIVLNIASWLCTQLVHGQVTVEAIIYKLYVIMYL